EATPTYVQVINFNLDGISLDEFMGVANGVASDFAALPGLIAKSWLSDKANNTYGGVYLWETQKSCEAYRNGDLYAGALTNNPAFSNLTDRGFDILEGPSRVTYMK
ncbi:MAG: YdhR family protein, partial [Pseudomonadota bacterium]|nr:YdhR family protein [Pseudomonadota bacterium]